MYLPKSKYKGNLYTIGDEYIIPGRSAAYVGPYFTTSNREAYTGAEPSKASVRLESLVQRDAGPTAPTSNIAYTDYDSVRKNTEEVNLKATLPINTYYPKPTEEDYKKGMFTRYFIRDKHTGRVQEVDTEVYRALKAKTTKYYYPKYDITQIEWSLTSTQANFSELRVSTRIIPELLNYVKDPSQFVK